MRVSRRSAVDPFIVMDVMEAARAAEARGRDIVHMEVGQPGTGAPAAARRRLAEERRRGRLATRSRWGGPICAQQSLGLYAEWYDLDLDPARRGPDLGCVRAGSSLRFSALFDAGDRVGAGGTLLPLLPPILTAMSLEPVVLRTELASRYQPVAAQLTDGPAGADRRKPRQPDGDDAGQTRVAGFE